MDIYEKVTKSMQILNAKYDWETVGKKYSPYVETVCEFEGSKESLLEVLQIYKDVIKDYLLSSQYHKDVIMQENRLHRHDLELTDEVDLDAVIEAIFNGTELEGFQERAKDVILLETMNLCNTYGMNMLRENSTTIRKEVAYGIYWMKTDPSRNLINERKDPKEPNAHSERNFEELMRLGDKYGSKSLPYIEYLELLQKRSTSLLEVAPSAVKEELQTLTETIAKVIEAKNNPESTLEIDTEMLQGLYESYNKINHITLKSLMSNELPHIIDSPTGQLLMLHFIQDSSNTSFDREMNEFFEQEAIITAKKMISEETGRPYDEKLDGTRFKEILDRYHRSRQNPFDLESRLPLRCIYSGESGGTGFADVTTKPTTLLSVSITTPEDLNSHLDRRIAIGFLPEDIPLDAIAATSKRFNSEKDRVTFESGSYPISEIMQYGRAHQNTNETLVDWTKIKPSYILVVKDKEMLEPDILARAHELEEQNNLPIVIYDKYAIQRKKLENEKSTNKNN